MENKTTEVKYSEEWVALLLGEIAFNAQNGDVDNVIETTQKLLAYIRKLIK